jgi:CrcB protein
VSPATWAAFALAAAIGAPARYVVDSVVQERADRDLPVGTLLVNITGSFLLGLITGLAAHHGLSTAAKTVLGTGFCGAYTTFSTFTFETVRLAEEGDYGDAARNVGLSLFIGALAAAAGLALPAVV